MAISRHTSSHLCKICRFYTKFVPNITKNQRTVAKICRFLNIFYTKLVIALLLADTLNLLKESSISTYLTSTSLLFIERHDKFFVLNQIWIERKVHIFQNIVSTTHITKGIRLSKT